jgi:hypothetical protein
MPRPNSYNAEEDNILLEWLALPASAQSLKLNQTHAYNEAAAYLAKAGVSPPLIVRSWESVKKRFDIIVKPKSNGKFFIILFLI